MIPVKDPIAALQLALPLVVDELPTISKIYALFV
jgi:hypothetical protein